MPGKGGATMESEKDSEPVRRPSMSYMMERRVSQAEVLRRMSWLQKARSSRQLMRLRGALMKENYKAHIPDNFGGVYTLRYSPTGHALATGFGYGVIQVRDPDTGELKASLRSSLEAHMPVMGCRFHPMHQDIFYASCADGSILQCDAEHCEVFKFAFEENNQVNALDISPDGNTLITGGKDTAIRVYDLNTRQVVQEYCRSMLDQSNSVLFHTLRIFSIRVHDTMQNIFVSGGWDDSVKIWDLRVTVGCVGKIRGPHISGDSIDLRSNMILTGSWVQKDSLQLWDIRTHELLKNLTPTNRPPPPDGEFLYTAQFFDGDPYGDTVLAGGSGIKAVEAITISNKMLVGKFPVENAMHTVDSYSHMLAYGGMDPYLYIASFS